MQWSKTTDDEQVGVKMRSDKWVTTLPRWYGSDLSVGPVVIAK